ncbi:PadR family transcriptional regulator [Microbacterium caowuchunii]|uniref:PadR family transcriptional regulator n=1 Tax=Microbacterium caowuchunii TaxID=2614638 RepID=A0A5N0TNS3_9MICO|nr:PadR family transcriptional regulator [Microbacterium caowuchunii]KAA9135857.1 PadR family transcriptional regulator [Microbacterium caowuchunii]
MSGSFMGDAFGARGRGAGDNWSMSSIWDAMDQLRSTFEQKVGGATRMQRGDVRAAVLALLSERPMHGYQIINEIGERSGGSWKPSPGSVYPTLQLLSDEGLIRAEESGGRKTYSLTEEGRLVAAEETGRSAPWETSSSGRDSGKHGALPKAGVDLAQAVAQVARTGNPDQVREAVAVLDDARRKLYSILAQD